MSSAVYYKLKAQPHTKLITFQGDRISLYELKLKILENEKMNPAENDLNVMNSSTLRDVA